MTDLAGASALQFGQAAPGRAYRDRPAVFGVATRAGKVAVVHVRRPQQDYIDLPGGGVEPGESEAEALAREFGEETGLVICVGACLTRSGQFLVTADGELANNRAGHYEVVVAGEDARLKIETDHALEWLGATRR